jgi:large repetitive protein
MNKILYTLGVLILLLTSNLSAQFVDYERDNGWKLGFNMGGTWQEQEAIPNTNFATKPYAGFSGGLTFGKSIFERPGSFLAFDLRYRFLAGKSYGWLGVPTTDSLVTGNEIPHGFLNYRFGYRENTLEGVLTLHSLRERTGILLYGFGGVGFTRYNVMSDFKDFAGNYNNYNSIDTTQPHLAIATALRNSSDLDFETEIIGSKVRFMPSLGIGIGYQITPSFAMGVEHKITYALNDEIDGHFDNGKNDKYHYTALIFRWGLLRSRPSYKPTSNTNINDYSTQPTTVTTPTTPTTPVVTGNKPLVNIYNPSTHNTVVHNASYTVRAKIYYVANNANVTFRHNGTQIYGFTFNPTSNEFSANVILTEGVNTFEIIGTNNFGNDQDSKQIILQSMVYTTAPPPVVKFTNPPYTPFNVTSTNNQFSVTAQLFNVVSSANVKFKVNGVFVNSFTFNPSTNHFASTVMLVQGANVLEIVGSNSIGHASDLVTINYSRQETIAPPVVTILTPSVSPYNTASPVEIVNGTVLNVASANQINVNINGSTISNFNYDYSTKKISFSANLIAGANVVTITASNNAGIDSKTTTLIFKPSEIVNLPVVDFTIPLTSPFSSPNQNMTLKATVLNVNSKNDITVTGNGFTITNFSYNHVTKEVTFNTNLVAGSNIFKIVGVNTAGSDDDEVIITHKGVSTVLPPVVTVTNPIASPHLAVVTQYTITAKIINIDGAQNVGFVYNGVSSNNFTYNPSNKEFIASVLLNEGNNTFQISGTNILGTDSKSGTINYQKPQEAQPPLVVITAPAINPFETYTNSEIVNATVYNVATASDVVVQINGSGITNFNFDQTSKKVSFTANLNLGANVIQISGSNSVGVDSKMTTIIRKEVPQTPLPIVQFTAPIISPTTVATNTHTLKGTVLNVAGQNNITVMGNGVQINNFTYNSTTKEVVFSSNLINGSNLFTIKGTNSAGSAQAETILIYNFVEPIVPPIVNITQPNTNPFNTTIETVTIYADVLNVNAVTGVAAQFNGQAIGGFSFDPATHAFVYAATLMPGANTLTVTGTNSAGVASKTQTILYNPPPPCVSPSILLSQPEASAANSAVGSATVNTDNNKGALIGKITGATSVSFKVNGQVSPGYTYHPKTGVFESMLNLTEGANSYQILATNACGTTVINVTYIFTPVVNCNEPVITFITPAISPLNYTGPSTNTFSASVLNLENAQQVTVRLNGAVINTNVDMSTGMVAGSATLVPGANTIRITAKNSCGTIEKETVINFTQPIQPPVVAISKPTTNPFSTTSNTVVVEASVTNVVQSGIGVTLEGQPISTWQFNPVNNKVTVQLNLPIGDHTITISGTNVAGSDSKSTEVIVTTQAPVVEFLNIPSTSSSQPHNVASTQFTVLGRVLNYQNANVSFEKNGASSIDFVYNSSNGEFSIPLQQVAANSSNPSPNQLFSVKIKASNSGGNDAKMGYVKFPDITNTTTTTTTPGTPSNIVDNCIPVITAIYSTNHQSIQVTSSLDLTNAVLKFHDNTIQKVNNLSGTTTTMQGNGVHAGKCIVGAWIKSGCNSSTDGPGYGEWKPNSAFGGSCGEPIAPETTTSTTPTAPTAPASETTSTPTTSENCVPTVGAVFSNDHKLVQATSTKDLSNVVLKFSDNATQKFDNLSGLHGTFQGTAGNVGKCIVGVWIKSGCNSSNDGPGYGEWRSNAAYNGACESVNTGGTSGNNGNPNGNNGHGNNADGVDSSNPGQGGGGPNGAVDQSQGEDDESKGGGVSTSNNTSAGGNSGGGNNQNTGGNCIPVVQASFNYLHSAVQVSSNKNLSNVVLKFSDNSTQKFDNLSGLTGVFQGTGVSLNKCIVGIWIKSGCNSSDDGPGYGEWRANANYNGSCEMMNSAPAGNGIGQQQNNKQQHDEFNHNIQKGDIYFNAKNYATAKTFYQKASALRPNDAYSKQRIVECDKMLQPVKPTTPVVTPTKPVVTPSNTTTPPKTNTTPVKPTAPVNTVPVKDGSGGVKSGDSSTPVKVTAPALGKPGVQPVTTPVKSGGLPNKP